MSEDALSEVGFHDPSTSSRLRHGSAVGMADLEYWRCWVGARKNTKTRNDPTLTNGAWGTRTEKQTPRVVRDDISFDGAKLLPREDD